MYFIGFIGVSLMAGILLGKLIQKRWTAILTVIASCVVFYFFDLDTSSLLLGFFAIFIGYIYFFKKFNKDNTL